MRTDEQIGGGTDDTIQFGRELFERVREANAGLDHADPEIEILGPVALAPAADLRQRILTGEFPPGSRLKFDDIAAICSVSHMPVRGALHMLEREGVLARVGLAS